MGNFLSIFNKNKDFRILMQGLDASGKTTILYRLKLGTVLTTIPTIGFNVETLDFKNLKFTVWDLGGRDKIRPLFRHYYPNTDALIFVIDSNDKERLEDIKHEMEITLKEDSLKDCIIMILANKQDLNDAASVTFVTEYLELHKLKRQCNVFGTCATTGEGLEEAFTWLADVLDPKSTPHSETESDAIPDNEKSYFQKGIEVIKKLFTSKQ